MNRKIMYPICCVLGFLAFLVFPAINYAGPNSSAGSALDLDYTTHDYDPGITSKDIDSTADASVGEEIWVAVVAQNVTNLDTYQVEVVFDANRMAFIEGHEDNPFAGVTNLLKTNGGSTIGFQAVENVAGTVNVANALVGTSTDEAPEGSGIIALLKFQVLDEDASNQLTLSNVHYLDSGGVDDPITNLMDAVINGSPPCTDNSDCDSSFFCKKPEGDCDGDGMCTLRPDVCPDTYDPVCGCDEQTYDNECKAALAGVSVKFQGECGPEITVKQDNVEIPDDTGSYDFGKWPLGAQNPVTFTICNEGNGPLDLTSVDTVGANATDFEVTVEPPAQVFPGACVSFEITFSPNDFGLRSAEVFINNNDSDENPYDFELKGEGPDTTPEINAKQDGVDIPDDTGNYDFGGVPDCECKEITFTVENQGNEALTLSPVQILGACAADFEVTMQPPAEIPAGSSETFEITYCPGGVGECSAEVLINNNDADENPYNFSIEGEGLPCICNTNTDCGAEFYCKRPEGNCDGEGVCTLIPEVCPDVYDPICGCDGLTYGNECEAAMEGMSVDYRGECSADLSVSKSDDPDPVSYGNMLTYFITVSNAGPADAVNVTLTDDVPIGNPEYSTDGGSTWNPWNGSVNLGTIAAGGSQEVQIRGMVGGVSAHDGGVGVFLIRNTATVSSDTCDTDDANNTDTEDTAGKNGVFYYFSEDLETGELASYWTTNSTGAGRIRVTKAHGPCGGSYHLTMDSARWRTPSLNELVLTLDLAGQSGLMLAFSHKEFNDEDHVMPDTFTGSHNSDGVAISADGDTWYRVQGLTSADVISSDCQGYEVDLDAAIASAGIAYTSSFKIKLQQYGKDPIVSTTFPFSDGFAFDDIEVYQGIIDNDSDGDGLPDDWEQEYFGNLLQGPGDDYDVDGLDNLGEWQQGTDPTDSDTDADQVPDGWEVRYGLDPLDPCDAGEDLDGDGSTNLEEYLAGTDPSGATASFPFVENFESGDLENYWTTYSTNRGRIQVTALNGPASGSYHLTMDSSHYMNLSLNELVLSINLASQSGVTLHFYHKHFNDDSNVMPSSFTGSHNSDGVAISDDGATWYKVQGLTGADGISSVWQCYEVDLDAAAMAAGISYNSAFKIKFQQYGKDPIVSSTFPFSDGFAFDDIEVAEMH